MDALIGLVNLGLGLYFFLAFRLHGGLFNMIVAPLCLMLAGAVFVVAIDKWLDG